LAQPIARFSAGCSVWPRLVAFAHAVPDQGANQQRHMRQQGQAHDPTFIFQIEKQFADPSVAVVALGASARNLSEDKETFGSGVKSSPS